VPAAGPGAASALSALAATSKLGGQTSKLDWAFQALTCRSTATARSVFVPSANITPLVTMTNAPDPAVEAEAAMEAAATPTRRCQAAVGPARHCSQRHMMPFKSRNEVLKAAG